MSRRRSAGRLSRVGHRSPVLQHHSEVKALPVVLTKIALVLAALLLAQSTVALLDGYRFLSFVRRRRAAPTGNYLPPVAVIIPCKGVNSEFELNLSSFLAQDYARYQVILAVASENDAAYGALSARLRQISALEPDAPLKTRLVVAGYSDVRGEKVNNLLSGISVVDPETEVLVFADIDARPAHDWLRSLVGPLQDEKVTVSTGFRWYLPGPGFVSQLRAAWDTSIATLLGDHDHNFAWGGSMAIRFTDFRSLRVAEQYWANTVSDDYALTRAVRDIGGRIHFEPRCLLASREASTLREFLRWANRQIIITRVYSAHLWWMGLIANALYCATYLLGLGLIVFFGPSFGVRAAIAGLLVGILLLGMAKGRIRMVVAIEIFPEENEALTRFGSRYWQLAPFVPWVMLFNFVAAGLTRRIEWQGTHYELRSSREVRILRRDSP